MASNCDESAKVHPDLLPVLKQLKKLYNDVKRLSGGAEELARLQGILNSIDDTRVNGIFKVSDKTDEVPEGQATLHEALHQCYTAVCDARNLLEMMEDGVHPELDEHKEELDRILKKLENPHIAENDLLRLQGRLDVIDSKRVNGVFQGVLDPNKVLQGQGVLHDMMHQAYTRIHRHYCNIEKEKNSHHPKIDSELLVLKKELEGIKKALENFHGDSERLKHLQGQIIAIDHKRSNAALNVKTNPDGTLYVPKGQAEINELLFQCHSEANCRLVLMEKRSSEIDPSLKHYEHQLEGLLKDINTAKNDISKLPKLQGRLFQLDSKRRNGMFIPEDKSVKPESVKGHAVLHDMLHEAYELIHRIQCKDTSDEA